MNALQAMTTVLDINETIEQLKIRNSDAVPDLTLCKTVDLLEKYRQLLGLEMAETDLKVFQKSVDKQ